MAQTAEGAMQESANILQRMRDLSLQSASDALDTKLVELNAVTTRSAWDDTAQGTAKRNVRLEILDKGDYEFPFVNPQYVCHKHRFGYFAQRSKDDVFFSGIVRIEKRRKEHLPKYWSVDKGSRGQGFKPALSRGGD